MSCGINELDATRLLLRIRSVGNKNGMSELPEKTHREHGLAH